MDRARLYEFMAQQRLGVVSSVAADGSPQSALVCIATTPGLEIVFDTMDSTRKYANLLSRPRCSVVLGWGGMQTVQVEGEAELLQGAELERCRDVYFAALTNAPARLRWPGLTYFLVRPRWIRYSDFYQGPPLVQEFRPGA